MPTKKSSKKSAAKKPAARKAGSSGVTNKKKSVAKTITKKLSSPGVISGATKIVSEALVGVAGAAKAAVVGVAEAGSKVTGIGQPEAKTSASTKGKRK
jgi:hypothetical protein